MASNKGNGKNNTKTQKKRTNNVKQNKSEKKQDLEQTNVLDIIIDDERLTDKDSLDVSFIEEKGRKKKKKAAKAIEVLEQDINYETVEDLERPIKKNNEILYELPLNKDKTVDLKGNILVIKDGKAFIESADCKNQICVNHKPISKTGETIVCLPHKVLVEIK